MVIPVLQGTAFKEMEAAYEINPAEPENFKLLAESLKSKNQLPEQIVHLWSESFAGSSLETQLDRGVYSIFHASRALTMAGVKEKVHMLYLYTQQDELMAINGAVSAFFKSILIEGSKVEGRVVDIGNEAGAVPQIILDELRIAAMVPDVR